MSIMELAKTPEHNRPPIITIFGDNGTGKTSLAATFPKPLFLRTHGENVPRDTPHGVHVLPPVASSGEILDILTKIYEDDHDFKTLVVDSISGIDVIFESEVVASDPAEPKDISECFGGFGAGSKILADRHSVFFGRLQKIADHKKMNIIFLAQVQRDRVQNPDQDAFDIYNLRLNKKSRQIYIDASDCVAFLKLKSLTTSFAGTKRKQAVSHGERELICHASASNVSKNRYGIKEPLILTQDENPFKEYLI